MSQHDDYPIQPQASKRRRWWKWLLYPGLIGLIFFVALAIGARSSSESLWEYLRDASKRYISPTLSLTSPLGALTSDPENSLIGAQEDRINVLLLGIGGRGHEGSNLTDTIIVASYKPSTKEVAMLSIPRDLIVPIPGHGWRKINNLYALAEYNDTGTGGDYSKQIISQIFDLQIPYYLRIDFAGFTELIDLVGGIDVNVPRTLSDTQYPIPGREEAPEDQRYEHLYIEEGQQHLDGETALKYVRSRHAQGLEGSDFARAARQQLVVEALMDKVFSLNTLLRPSKIKKIESNISEHIDTNLDFDQLTAFAKLAAGYLEEKKPIISRVLSDAQDGPLQAANYGGAFVLEPKVEDFSELKFIADNIFQPEMVYERASEDTGLPRIVLENPVEAKETATLEIQNGTFVNGLARATQDKLTSLGYEIAAVSNAPTQDVTQTIIYDFSEGQFPATLDFLAGNYTDNITDKIPLGISSSADFLIVLGLDAAY
jgi:LCP family protein required for cell wall assembly